MDGVGEVLAFVEGGWWDGTGLGEIAGGFEGEVVEVAPGTVGGEDELGVVWEVELHTTLGKLHCKKVGCRIKSKHTWKEPS